MIQSQFRAILARTGQQRCHIPVQVEMSYDGTDPLAIVMTFTIADEEPIPWATSRDLLVEAMASDTLTGQGDIRFIRNQRSDYLLVCVESPDGHADIKFPLQQVAEFLTETEDEAAEAVKSLGDLVDEAIRGILG